MNSGNKGLLVLVAVLAALPLVMVNPYLYDVAIRIALNAMVVIALNLLIGYTGQISLGHAGFLGIGAKPEHPDRPLPRPLPRPARPAVGDAVGTDAQR